MYSDQPPAAARVVKTIAAPAAPSSALPVSALDQVRKLRKTGAADTTPAAGVVLFSASWCEYCSKAKDYLAEKGISYRDYDIETATGLDAYARAGGHKLIPLLVSGGRRIEGFSTAAYDRFFSAAGSAH